MKMCLALFFSSIVMTGAYATNEKPVCEFTREHLAKKLKIIAECNDDYLVFCSDTTETQKNGCTGKITQGKEASLRISGFNIYNLGMEQDFKGNKLTIFKDAAILAEVINQFDLVAAIEMKHQAKEDQSFNQALLKSGKIDLEYRIPPYLEVLQSLQASDPTWTLILSTDLLGVSAVDTLNNELAGFYYRSNKVQPVATEYCEGLACTVPESEFKAEVARKPFMASFKSGKLDFTMLAVHFRYRYPTVKAVLNQPVYKKMVEVYDFETHTGYIFDKKVKSQQEEKFETLTRFSEVKSVSNFIGKLVSESKRKDVILYGDFNLVAPGEAEELPVKERHAQKNTAFKKAWYDKKGVLEKFAGAKPYINQVSTVGKESLINAYDHFVFSKSGSLKGCDTENAQVFNFTSKEDFPSGDEMISKLELKTIEDKFKAEMKFEKNKLVPRYSSTKVGYLAQGYQTKVLDAYEQGLFTVYSELISDHLPIFMDCNR